MLNPTTTVNASRIEESISMIERYVDTEALGPLLDLLRQLAERPEDQALLERVFETLNGLGITQGAVLTYAPYIAILLSEHQSRDPD